MLFNAWSAFIKIRKLNKQKQFHMLAKLFETFI